MKREYYVYEWVRLDTNETFYIGKGKGNRWRLATRGNNKHFNRIVESVPVAVVILEDNLDENTAYEYEIYYINEYKNLGFPLVNISDGGLDIGCSSKYLSENNYYTKTPKGQRFGEKPVVCLNYYGENIPKIYKSLSLSEDEFKGANISKCCNKIHKKAGKTKTNDWAVWVWKEEYINLSNEDIFRMIKDANYNKIICLNDNKIFSSSVEAGQYYKIDNSNIVRVCNGLKPSAKGYVFMRYYDYFDNPPQSIKIYKYEPQNKSVVCLETGEVFVSMGEAERLYELKKGSISTHISGNCYKHGIYSKKENKLLNFKKGGKLNEEIL